MNKLIVSIFLLLVSSSTLAHSVTMNGVTIHQCTKKNVCLRLVAPSAAQSLLGEVLALNEARIEFLDKRTQFIEKSLLVNLVIVDQGGGEISWYDEEGNMLGSVEI